MHLDMKQRYATATSDIESKCAASLSVLSQVCSILDICVYKACFLTVVGWAEKTQDSSAFPRFLCIDGATKYILY